MQIGTSSLFLPGPTAGGRLPSAGVRADGRHPRERISSWEQDGGNRDFWLSAASPATSTRGGTRGRLGPILHHPPDGCGALHITLYSSGLKATRR